MTYHVTPEGYIEIPISEEMLTRAEASADEIPDQNNTIRGREGRIVGALGEECFSLWTGAPLSRTYDYDLVIDSIRFDTKTKDRTVYPEPHYEASVYAKNTTQDCDVYVAISLYRRAGSKKFTRAYLIGWLSKDDYYKHAKFRAEGHVDPSNGQPATEACFQVEHRLFNRFIP